MVVVCLKNNKYLLEVIWNRIIEGQNGGFALEPPNLSFQL